MKQVCSDKLGTLMYHEQKTKFFCLYFWIIWVHLIGTKLIYSTLLCVKFVTGLV